MLSMILLGAAWTANGAVIQPRAAPTQSPRDLAAHPMPKENPRHWIALEGYPSEARVKKLEGRTGYQVHVDEAGQAQDCQIVQSSGHAILDRATCRRVMAHAEFYRAYDRSGRAVAGTFAGGYTWRLPSNRRRTR